MIGFGRGPCDEGLVHGAAAGPGCPARSKIFVLAATILGSSLAFIDGSVVNVALPAIQLALHMSAAGAQWVVNAYLLMLGALVLIGGSAGDRFGRRRIFVAGVTIFTLSSVACGLAPDTAALIAARAVQGIGSALLVPTSLAIISAAFSAAERGQAIGTWAGFSALTTALGPVLGGWLVDTISWRAIFFINLPIAVLAIGLTLTHVPESRRALEHARVDWKGGMLAMLGLACLTYGLTSTTTLGWTHPTVAGALLLGAALLASFIWSETRAPSPMVPLRLFRSPSFSAANAMTFLLYFALGGAFFFLPFDLIRLQGYSATQAGAAFLPFTLIMGGLSLWSGGLVARYGARKPLTVGPIVAASGIALLAVPGIGGTYWATFFPAMIVVGLGMAVSVAPLTTTVMSSVDEPHSGTASGINNAVARIAGLMAVALLGVLAIAVFRASLDARLSELQVPREIRRELEPEIPKLAEATVPSTIGGDTRRTLEQALDEAFLRTFRIEMLVAACLALLSALCAQPMSMPKRAPLGAGAARSPR